MLDEAWEKYLDFKKKYLSDKMIKNFEDVVERAREWRYQDFQAYASKKLLINSLLKHIDLLKEYNRPAGPLIYDDLYDGSGVAKTEFSDFRKETIPMLQKMQKGLDALWKKREG